MRLHSLYSTLLLQSTLVHSKLPCFDTVTDEAHRCAPPFENAAFRKVIDVSNTCGTSRPEEFYRQTGRRTAGMPRLVCDNSKTSLMHPPSYLTDHEDKDTWWQSQSMYDARKYGAGIQFPQNVTLVLDLRKNYEIISIRLKFHSPRPESMMIEKFHNGKWSPYQYFSASCFQTYNKTEDTYIIPKINEKMALCDSQYSKISPLSGGEIIFATLGNRPSNENFEDSKVLQEFVTASKLRVVLTRMNTFGDELFQDQRVLQSYYYAISDFVVGGKCLCNGHADNCNKTSIYTGNPICDCQHNTMGDDCDQCLPLFNNKPWKRATTSDPAVCEKCECNNLADECVFDEDLGSGRCIGCKENTAGAQCEECAENHFRDPETNKCVPCNCHVEGSHSAQCDANGNCDCQIGVIGVKCDQCQDGFYGLTRTGCQPCLCNIAGSQANEPACDAETGQCECKDNVTGKRCDRCRSGFMGVDNSNGESGPDTTNEFGCTPCFCYNHSNECKASKDFVKATIDAEFSTNDNGWTDLDGNPIEHLDLMGQVSSQNGFTASPDFTGSQRLSYNQKLHFDLVLENDIYAVDGARFILEGRNELSEIVKLTHQLRDPSTSHTRFTVPLHEKYIKPEFGDITANEFITVLDNVENIKIEVGPATLDNVQLETAEPSLGHRDADIANWVEVCQEHKYIGNSLEECSEWFTRSTNLDKGQSLVSDAFADCVECNCNRHSLVPCDPSTGVCECIHNTTGAHCEKCAEGFYGDAQSGKRDDCKACPCPDNTACHLIDIVEGAGNPVGFADNIPVHCTNCPHGSTGARCEECKENFYGDPIGIHGSITRTCQECQCNGNVDLLMVGNCDRFTGECKKCLYNTEGGNCQLCRAGYYGDPTAPKEDQSWKGCRDCQCDPSGTTAGGVCDSLTGGCPCLPGVTGKQCTECEPQHYGFGKYSDGCRACNCDPVGSVSGECNADEYGDYICQCKPGVTGTKCDQCMDGYYGMDRDGCKACDCDMQGSKSEQCDNEGKCACEEGVQGDKCDKCALNHYDISAGCKKCDACYNLVEHTYNNHKNELSRLRRMATDLTDEPTMLNSDSEFNNALTTLSLESKALEEDSQKILHGYEAMMQQLRDAAGNAEDITEKLDEFAAELETCETDVSDAKTKQKATEGTIHTLRAAIVEIEQTLADTENSISAAEQMAEEQKSRHAELLLLAQQSTNFLDVIQNRSEDVQNKAAEAKETADRARQEISTSMETLRKLKEKLERIGSNDVHATITRIIDAKNRAKNAKEAAENARARALDILAAVNKITIPNLSASALGLSNNRQDDEKQDVEMIAKRIENEADALQHKLHVLLNEFNEKKSSLKNSQDAADRKYREGKTLVDQAEQLMAMVHAAKMDARDATGKINELIEKARTLYEQLSKFHTQFAQDSPRNGYQEGSEADFPDISKKLEVAEAQYQLLDEHVQQLENEASRVYDDADAAAKDASQELTDATNSMKQAQDLEESVDEALAELKKKDDMRQDLDGTIDAKSDEIDDQLLESKQAQAKAQQTKDKAELSKSHLETLVKLVDQLKSDNLNAMLEATKELVNDYNTCQGADVCLKRVRDSFEAHKGRFEQIKLDQEANLNKLKKDLSEDKDKLESMMEKKKALTDQVNNLENIRSVLPNWCGDESDNENDRR